MRSSLEIEWIKRANFWNKEQKGKQGTNTGYLLQVMAVNPSIDEAPQLQLQLQDKADIQPLRACKHALMLVLGIGRS
jgi:hypothetical protein